MGWVTLLLFPIPAYLVLHYFEDFSFEDFIQWSSLSFYPVFWGLISGIIYALIANKILSFKIFDEAPLKVDELVRSLNLKLHDAIFLSLCAGIGEELLFRVGFQFYLGPFITSILFVAVHGYLTPFNWRQSLYGLVVLPLSFMLGYGFESMGLWFSIALHSMYDFVLFYAFIHNDKQSF
jgi:uncharacterized protein